MYVVRFRSTYSAWYWRYNAVGMVEYNVLSPSTDVADGHFGLSIGAEVGSVM